MAIGKVAMRYYQNYRDDAPPEWIERPARTFMNLLEVPVLFYVACVLMIALQRCDAAQVALAWIFPPRLRKMAGRPVPVPGCPNARVSAVTIEDYTRDRWSRDRRPLLERIAYQGIGAS